jgi:uncharacterized protein (TIGR03032 family)
VNNLPTFVRPAVESVRSDHQPPAPMEFRFSQSDSFVALLQQLGATLLVSTYQANKLLTVRACADGLSILVRTFDRPMGLAVSGRRLDIGTRKEIWSLRNAPDIASRIVPAGMHDAFYLPRSSHITGDIGVHEIAWGTLASPSTSDTGRGEKELWIVSTRFSCLCTLDADYSFVPRWQPSFVSEFAAEDRCHLNGLAIVDDEVKYVTALGTTDVRDGWRADKACGGCVIDVPSGEFVARGLSMPHSPRWHDGRLWVLESGTGGLLLIDPDSGRYETVARLPGFARGVAFAGPFAFVGLSKIRPTSAMNGVPLAAQRDQLKCGIAVIDLRNARTIGLLEFQSAVEEIFDVQLLLGIRFPEVLGFQKEALHHTFIIPPTTAIPVSASSVL